jgi:hypothetical protein
LISNTKKILINCISDRNLKEIKTVDYQYLYTMLLYV